MPAEVPAADNRNEPAWASSSFEQALAPTPGQRIREALLTTYSADLPALVVALQALAGFSLKAGDRIGPGKLTLVQTLDRLRDVKVRVAVQAGRLRGATRAKIGGLLDQFVYQVQQDEEQGSWHAKMALLRFSKEDAHTEEIVEEWRFWMGSRNLTSSENAELGLLLESASGGAVVNGLDAAVRQLARHSGYTAANANTLAESIKNVRWALPAGCSTLKVFCPSKGLPAAPGDLDELIVVSPFLNVDPLLRLAEWGGKTTYRSLVSTRLALGELACSVSAPLSRFDQLLEWQSPQQEAIDPATEDGLANSKPDEAPLGEEEFAPYRRLHAKLIAARKGKQHTMWLGSANATGRGWSGRNMELVARMEVDRGVWAGLKDWMERARLSELSSLDATMMEEASQLCLERERKRLAAQWKGVLFFEAEHTRLVAGPVCPSPADSRVLLRAGLYTLDDLQLWPEGSQEFLLPPVPLAQQTGLVRVELRHEDGPRLEWLLCCQCVPELTKARDVAALSEYLGPEDLLAWWKASLRDEPDTAGDEPWDEPQSCGSAESAAGRGNDPLTLEDMLRGWARSPAAFQREGMKMGAYLAHWQRHGDKTGEAAQELAAMHQLWRMLDGERR